jgi:pimeloyl-ACP methyl ester carboxylesterase
VLALDLPGHGKAAGPGRGDLRQLGDDVRRWMDGLNLPPACLAGHSMGAAIALLLALDAPDMVAGLILVGAASPMRVNPRLLEAFAQPAMVSEGIDLVMRWSFRREALESLRRPVRKSLQATPPEVLAADFAACDRFDAGDRLGLIRAPTLVMVGAEDRMTPPAEGERLAARIPGARLAVIPEAGHMVPLERPAEVAEAMEAFLAQVLREGTSP